MRQLQQIFNKTWKELIYTQKIHGQTRQTGEKCRPMHGLRDMDILYEHRGSEHT